MIKVLQVIPALNTGGVEHTTLHVANSLGSKKEASYVASSGGNLTNELDEGVYHFTLPTLNSKNPIEIFLNAQRLAEIIKKNGIKIVHARSRACGWSAYFASKKTKTRFVTTYHGAYGQNCLKWYYNRVMAYGNPVVVASKYMHNHVKNFYHFAKTFEIPSGIDTKYFCKNSTTLAEALNLRDSLNIENDKKTILLLGRFTSIKGHIELLRAVNASCLLTQKAHVVFVGNCGNPGLVNELTNYASSNNIKLHVFFDQKDLRPFFELANIVVVPTNKPEAFGRVTVEAMSMEKCVIVNDLGASGEVLGDQSWVYESRDSVNKLSEKLLQAFALSDDELEIIGKKNRLRAIKMYDLEVMLSKHFELYEGL